MKKALQVAMFSLFTVIGFNAQANEHHHETMSEAQPQVISATGEVKGIDLESKKITIHHDPIAAVFLPGDSYMAPRYSKIAVFVDIVS